MNHNSKKTFLLLVHLIIIFWSPHYPLHAMQRDETANQFFSPVKISLPPSEQMCTMGEYNACKDLYKLRALKGKQKQEKEKLRYLVRKIELKLKNNFYKSLGLGILTPTFSQLAKKIRADDLRISSTIYEMIRQAINQHAKLCQDRRTCIPKTFLSNQFRQNYYQEKRVIIDSTIDKLCLFQTPDLPAKCGHISPFLHHLNKLGNKQHFDLYQDEQSYPLAYELMGFKRLHDAKITGKGQKIFVAGLQVIHDLKETFPDSPRISESVGLLHYLTQAASLFVPDTMTKNSHESIIASLIKKPKNNMRELPPLAPNALVQLHPIEGKQFHHMFELAVKNGVRVINFSHQVEGRSISSSEGKVLKQYFDAKGVLVLAAGNHSGRLSEEIEKKRRGKKHLPFFLKKWFLENPKYQKGVIIVGDVRFNHKYGGLFSQAPYSFNHDLLSHRVINAPGNVNSLDPYAKIPEILDDFDGTSFSAAYVTSALALLQQAFPRASPQVLADRLLKYAYQAKTRGGKNAFHGQGILDLTSTLAGIRRELSKEK